MPHFFRSLAFKISSVVVIIQAISLVIIGTYMADYRLRIEEHRGVSLTAIPSELLSRGVISPQTVRDRLVLDRLVGTSVIEAYLLDSTGLVLYSTSAAAEGRMYDEVPGARPELLAAVQRSRTPQSLSSSRVRQLVSVAPVRLPHDSRASLHLRTETFARWQERARVMTVAIVGSLLYVLLTATILALLVNRLIVPRVRATTACLLRAENGQLDVRIDTPDSTDEIGSLQRSVNAMVAGIERQTAELKAQARALEESESRFKETADMLPQTVFECDLDGRFTFVNKQGYRTFGYTSGDVARGLTAMQLIVPGDHARAAGNMRKAALGGPSEGHEYAVVGKDGRVLPTVVYSNAVMRNGVPVGLRGIIIDLSEQRRAEEERTALQEQLGLSEKLQAVGQLAGGIAHDFNNQLTGIMGCAELVKEDLHDRPDLLVEVDAIITSARRAAELTAQLLAFARKGKYLSQPVDLHGTIAEVVRLLGRSIDKKITIRTELSAQRAVVVGDGTQLQNALLNLALNARDAMPRGGTITFSTGITELGTEECARLPGKVTPGRYLRVAVADTGVGMDADTRKHIFEPFFTTKEIGKGTGMGLPAVYGTVSNHKGSIDVISSPGVGSIFAMLLPLAPPGVVAETTVGGPKHPSVPAGLVVLVVDDEENVLRTAGQVLRGAGCTVITCSNGRDAVREYRESFRRIDVVVLDMIMPEMDGREVFAAMRALNPDVAAVLTSGYSLEGDAQRILKEGVRVFIQKPYGTDALLAAVAGVAHALPDPDV